MASASNIKVSNIEDGFALASISFHTLASFGQDMASGAFDGCVLEATIGKAGGV